MTNLATALSMEHLAMEEAFPEVDHGRSPLLQNYIVQKRRSVTKTATGIHLVEETRQSENDNCTIGKVVAIADMCFRYKDGTAWEEGPSFKVGDYLQIPRFGGFRFSVRWKGEEIEFVIFDHLQQIARIDGDPRKITTYL